MNKKLVTVIAVCVATCLFLAACHSGKGQMNIANPEKNPTAADSSSDQHIQPDELSWQQDTTPFTFSQYFYGSWATNYMWKDQYAMKLITKKTGVRIDRRFASGSDNDYLNTMIATGNLPDSIMLDWNNPAVTKLINLGLVYSMNELIKQYAPEFWDMLDPEMVQYHTVRGSLWYLPNFYEQKDRMTNGIPITPIRPWFIRNDLYQAIGSPTIATTEDLRHALERIKQLFPSVNPLGIDYFDVSKNGFEGSLSLDYLIYSFSPHLLEERVRDDLQEVLYPVRNDGFIDAFRYMNSLYREGLLDPNLLITKQEQYTQNMDTATYGVASAYIKDMYDSINPLIEQSLGADQTYMELDGVTVEGQEPRYPASRLLGWQGFFITKKAKDPGRIIRFAEYAWSEEGQMDARYGQEGDTYTMVNGLPEYTSDVLNLMINDNKAWYQKYGFNASTLLWRAGDLWDKAAFKDLISVHTDEYNAAMKLSRFNFDSYGLGMDNLEPEGSSTEGVINAKIKEIWNRTIPSLIMAKTDVEFEKVYSEFINQIDLIGAKQVEHVMYQRHIIDLKKKGIE